MHHPTIEFPNPDKEYMEDMDTYSQLMHLLLRESSIMSSAIRNKELAPVIHSLIQPTVTKRTLTKYVNHHEESVRMIVASHPKTSINDLEKLAIEIDRYTRVLA